MSDPFHIQWHITNLCNLRCKHCYQEDFSKKNDLTWAGLKRVADNTLATLSEWDRKACIHLTGGEPLLREELFSLLYYLDPRPEIEELAIITNGLLFSHDIVERLSAFPKLKKIKVSLDGADAEVHDSIRQTGVFEKVIQSLPMIQQENRFEVILMFTVMKRNYQSLLSLIRLCQDLGVDGLILERFIPLGRGREIVNEVLEKDQWKELLTTLSRFIAAEMNEDQLFPYQAFQIVFRQDDTELLGAPCVIGRDGLCIMPEGTVLPCRRFPVPIGNVLGDSLKDIWERSEILGKLSRKENLRGKCGTCRIEACRGCRSLALALTGDYLAEDPHCWYSLNA
jgi:radical SAM protein with 4Fe4S-binding SPASM domain